MQDIQQQNQQATDELQAKELRTKIYKCPNCGNFLHYDPDTNKLMCDHCHSYIDIVEVGGAMELAYHDGVENTFEPWGDVKAIKCECCGAITLLDAYSTAGDCAFCGAHNVVNLDELGGLKPNGVLPFRISRDIAMENYNKFLKKKLFAPFGMKKNLKKIESKGIYIPMFTFDCEANAYYTIRYGEHYTVTVGSGKNRRVETRTRWYVDSGTISSSFDDIQVEASKYITQSNVTGMGSFDTGNAKAYHSQYITGYQCERYSTGLDESWGTAKEEIYDALKRQIINRYCPDVVDYVNIDASYDDVTYKYVLVPIWMIDYRYNKKHYNCVVNGRSGKVTGKYPKSIFKICTAVLVGLGLIGLLYYLLMYVL